MTKANKIILLFLFSLKSAVFAQEKITNDNELEAFKVAYNAYIWGYPLVSYAMSIANETPNKEFNKFFFVDNTFSKQSAQSNMDSFYSKAYLDLSQGEILITLPVASTKYYSLMLADVFSNNFGNISSLKNPTKDPKVLIVGPDWNGTPPKGVKRVIKSPTNLAWIIGRSSINEKNDIADAKKTLESITIIVIPNPQGKKNWIEKQQYPKLKPGLNNNEQIFAMDWKTYFNWVSKMMGQIYENQKSYVTEFDKIGLNSSKEFDGSGNRSKAQKGIKQGILDAKELLLKETKGQADFFKNGWSVNINEGNWGMKYAKNAASAYKGFDQTQSEEIIKLKTETDNQNQKLNGDNSYRLLLKKEQIPQTSAFWTVTVLDENNFFTENSIDRYGVSSKNLKTSKDGSIAIYFQQTVPTGMETNWIPTPKSSFKVIVKVYSPNELVKSGEWIPDSIEKHTYVQEIVPATKTVKPKPTAKPKAKVTKK